MTELRHTESPRRHTRRSALKTLLGAGVSVLLPLRSPGASGEITVGSSLALSGPAQSLGRGMRSGMETCFAAVNERGGVLGKRIRLITLDDGYEPATARENMIRLVDKEQVLAVLGNVGTPTAEVTVPIANAKKTALLGAFTGANLLRKTPPDRHVINYRASYAEETSAMVAGLSLAGIRPFEIGFFSQNDSYGDAGYQGALQSLKASGYADADRLPHGRYKRNTLEIEEALLLLLESRIRPKAIIMIGAYSPCAKFIRLARKLLPRTLFLNVSFVDGMALARILGPQSDGVIVTQVVPHFRSDLALCRDYLADLKKHSPNDAPGFVSLEGYIVARIFIEGILRTVGELSRDRFVNGVESIHELDLGMGTTISYSATQHQGSHTVWTTVIRNGEFVSLRWEDLRA